MVYFASSRMVNGASTISGGIATIVSAETARSASRKIFRIEQMGLEGAGEPATDWPTPSEPAPMAIPAPASTARPVSMRAAPSTSDEAARRHHELIAEIKALRTLI